jgi:transcription antitermination factor NusG
MQKDWFVVYTKAEVERKVSSTLTKKKIENFVPQVTVETQSFMKNRLVLKPLFKKFVFVKATASEANTIKSIDGVINLMYWLGNPVIVPETEISSIKEFVRQYQYVNLQPLDVNSSMRNEKNLYSAQTIYNLTDSFVSVKTKAIKVVLPTLGYTMEAQLKSTQTPQLVEDLGAKMFTFAKS